MGRRWPNCGWFSCFRATFKPNEGAQLQPLPKPKEAEAIDGLPYIDAKEDSDILIIRNIDPCISLNGTNHHTDKYELMNRAIEPQLVVRRGQSFILELELSRPYDENRDGVSFIFTVDDDEKPSYGQGTLVGLPLMRKIDRSLSWNVIIDSEEDNKLRIKVIPSPECVVAKWRMDVDTKIIDNGAYSYSWDTKIYILYNPWCKLDQVYMKSEEWREEAVLNDVGLIWRGTSNRLRPCIWNYSQFDRDILDCALCLINCVGKVRGNYRNDPVVTTRALSAAVNSPDDNGCVMGNWTEDFGGGTPPTKWLGSKEILQLYYKIKKPVKYGQCWVFSGVLTTICRAVGIPARTITNYSSAHDTQSSLTVDYFMDERGKIMEELNSDSVWTFHVWTEVWMQRPDLGKEYDSWQVIDATPQELSEDMYRVGPTSVLAIKQGEVKRPYDGAFLFAEVNADKVYWRYNGPTQPLKLLNKDIHGIGKLISTKAPGSWDRLDITDTYKHEEKSNEERVTMLKALKQAKNMFARYYLNEDFNDIYFDFVLRDDIKIGQPFDVSLVMKNRSKTNVYAVSINLRVDAVTYTGKVGDSIKTDTYLVKVRPESINEAKMTVTYEEYHERIVDQCAFNISCLATVEDTKFEYYAQDDFRVRKPDIKIKLPDKVLQNQEVTAEIYLENPLPVPLRKGEFSVEGPGLENKLVLKVKKTIPPGEKAEAAFTFTPPRKGRQTIGAKFVSKELQDVDGFLVFMVDDWNEDNGNMV